MATDTAPTVRDFRCNGCGSPLKIPRNSRGNVTCPSCKTDAIIDGLVQNAEMAEKENIASGIPLSASSAMLHRKLVNYIAETPSMPLDVFDKGEVIREEHHCVPAFYFYCSGSASYMYEAGTEKEKDGDSRETSNWLDSGTTVRTEIIRYIEWSPQSSIANASGEVVASGNKEFGTKIRDLYMHLDQGKLYDYDELEYPPDVITHNFDLPQTASFNEYAKPYFEGLLEANAEKVLSSKITRDLTMGGSRIDKDEVVRIFLGLYRIVFSYGGKEYAIWVTGDGENAINEGMPTDNAQKTAIDNKKQAMERDVSAVPVPAAGKFTAGLWGSLALGVVLAGIGLGPFGVVLGIIGAIVFYVLRRNMMKPYEAQCSEIRSRYQNEINSLEAGAKNVVQQFKSKKQPLRGIYENKVAGDPNAF